MLARMEHVPSRAEARVYAPEVTPLLQSLLTALADFDFAYESNLEVVQNSAIDEAPKQQVVENLRQQHCERREPYSANHNPATLCPAATSSG